MARATLRTIKARGAGIAEYALVLVAILVIGVLAHKLVGRAANQASRDGRACLDGTDCRSVGPGAPQTVAANATSSDSDLGGNYGSSVGGSDKSAATNTSSASTTSSASDDSASSDDSTSNDTTSDRSLVASAPTEPTTETKVESDFWRRVETTVTTYPDGSKVTTTKDSGWFSSTSETRTVRSDGRDVTQSDTSSGIGILNYSTSSTKVKTKDGRVTVDTTDRKVYAGIPYVVDVDASLSLGSTVGIKTNASVLSGIIAEGRAGAFVQTSDGHIVGGGANVDVSAAKGVLAKVGGEVSTSVDPVTDARTSNANVTLKAGVGAEVSVEKREVRDLNSELVTTNYEGRAGVDAVIVNVGPKVTVETPADGETSWKVRPDVKLPVGSGKKKPEVPIAGKTKNAPDAKPAVAKAKPAEAKPADAKPADAKPAEAKSKEDAVATNDANGCVGAFCTRPGSCFVAGTPVWTDHGVVPIESLAEGDMVLARDPESRETSYRPVVTRFVREDRPITNVTLEAESGAVEHVRSTAEHPFAVVGHGFVPAGELAPGDLVETAAGPARVEALFTEATPERVYNFEVASFHTYFVGRTAAWVHNTCKQQPPEGWTKVKGAISHGQPVYKHPKKNLYISPDVDGHNVSNGWKMADSVKNLGSKKTRLGTYDADLKKIGD